MKKSRRRRSHDVYVVMMQMTSFRRCRCVVAVDVVVAKMLTSLQRRDDDGVSVVVLTSKSSRQRRREDVVSSSTSFSRPLRRHHADDIVSSSLRCSHRTKELSSIISRKRKQNVDSRLSSGTVAICYKL